MIWIQYEYLIYSTDLWEKRWCTVGGYPLPTSTHSRWLVRWWRRWRWGQHRPEWPALGTWSGRSIPEKTHTFTKVSVCGSSRHSCGCLPWKWYPHAYHDFQIDLMHKKLFVFRPVTEWILYHILIKHMTQNLNILWSLHDRKTTLYASTLPMTHYPFNSWKGWNQSKLLSF